MMESEAVGGSQGTRGGRKGVRGAEYKVGSEGLKGILVLSRGKECDGGLREASYAQV